MTVFNEIKSRLIFVPAAAVIRKGQALSVMTGRKEFADGKVSYLSNLKIKLYFYHLILLYFEFYTEK